MLACSEWLRVFLLISWLGSSVATAEKRHAIIIGANTGWAMDQKLRHAGDDANRLAATLVELGDFARADLTLLNDPTTEQVNAALTNSEAVARSEPGLFIFYFSGHSDGRYLHLQGAPLAFDDVFARLKAHPAKVKLGLFDSCQSGSLLASKGGKPTRTFDVTMDDAMPLQGTAILASSGADELSQEARVLQGSFFTHHLISAMRGAADENADGHISVNEAYDYASTRTTLDTLVSEAGVQRPVFRYELKGRGDIVLTRLADTSGALLFSSDLGRCFVTDDTEKKLVAEVPAGSTTRLMLPAGAYVVKCPTNQGYRVAALMARPQNTVAVKGLAFKELPLASGVLKGGAGNAQRDPIEQLKQQAMEALRAGQAEQAIGLYDAVLQKDLRDTDAYRGKAQAFLLLAQRNGGLEADRLRTAAVRMDPSLADDPQYRLLMPAQVSRAVPGSEDLAKRNLEAAYPRDHQRFGLGLALINPHGPLTISAELLVLPWLQFSAHFNFFAVGLGLSARGYPRSGSWTPYFGVGGNLTLAGLGVLQGPNFQVSTNSLVLLPRSTLDRLAYAEGGFQFAGRHWQAELGLALAYSAPLSLGAFFTVFPSVSGRYFF